MTRYRPAPQYLPASLVAAGLALLLTWWGASWPLAFVAAGLFVVSAAALYYLGSRPIIEIDDTLLKIGSQRIPWGEVERVDSTAWTSPLVVLLSLKNKRRIRVIYSGDVESADRLSRHVRRQAREALIDGIPYRQYWADALPRRVDPLSLPSPKVHLLRPEDEEEVERLYQRLKETRTSDERSAREDRLDS